MEKSVTDSTNNISGSTKQNNEKTDNLLKNLDTKFDDLLKRIKSLEKNNMSDVSDKIITAILSIFDQVSFVSEAEELKDFIENKTNELKQNYQMPTAKTDYSYTMEDVESDMVNLRLTLKNMAEADSNEEFEIISDNINKVISSCVNIENLLTKDEKEESKTEIEKLQDDVVDVSVRINKLLMEKEENTKSLSEINDKITDIDNTLTVDSIDEKSDEILNTVKEIVNSEKTTHQALGYVGEWIDSANGSINKINSIEDTINTLKEQMPEKANLLNTLSQHFEEQQERFDRLEMKVENILSSLDNIDDTNIIKRIDKIDKQLTKLSNNVEKLASYVDE